MQDLIDSIDEYNAAVELRACPIVHDPRVAEAMETVVNRHHKKFVHQLEETGGGYDIQ